MVSALIIPILVGAVAAISAYIVYRLVIYDYLCRQAVNDKLRKYRITKTPHEILKAYYNAKKEEISDKELLKLEKYYRQNEPDQFLTMYDTIRESLENEKEGGSSNKDSKK